MFAALLPFALGVPAPAGSDECARRAALAVALAACAGRAAERPQPAALCAADAPTAGALATSLRSALAGVGCSRSALSERERGAVALPAFAPAAAAADGGADARSCAQWRADVQACSAGTVTPASHLCAPGASSQQARAAYAQLARAVFGCAPGTQPRNTLVVHAMHGQSNRLRAYASARALAARTGRLLALVWQRDVHCSSRFEDLFEPPEGLLVLELYDESLFPAAVFRQYNYMRARQGRPSRMRDRVSWLRAGKYELIRDLASDHAHIYVRTAYVLNSRSAGNHRRPLLATRLAESLRALVPSAAVRAHLRAMAPLVRSAHNQSIIGVHVRMVTDVRRDVPGIERLRDSEQGVEAMLGATPYRAACHWQSFARAMESACGGATCTFYVASDDAAAIDGLRQWAARRAHVLLSLSAELLHGCSDGAAGGRSSRGARCQQVALADQLMLARSAFLLTSTWSSFSELVLLWNPGLLRRARSGCAPVVGPLAPTR
ncbi:hypothetical protein KFE25_013783 [Diacronema lutheri]|uniref:Uncharacterized protein n=1 Tax=Diacronema lutheri TaxID=2081491 RepID=A0A8J5Y023_DIALT|nr:hypothetical protein KFE25_013783 [Diacronema lutheri]